MAWPSESGRARHNGLPITPCVARDVDREGAVVEVLDSNLRRYFLELDTGSTTYATAYLTRCPLSLPTESSPLYRAITLLGPCQVGKFSASSGCISARTLFSGRAGR